MVTNSVIINEPREIFLTIEQSELERIPFESVNGVNNFKFEDCKSKLTWSQDQLRNHDLRYVSEKYFDFSSERIRLREAYTRLENLEDDILSVVFSSIGAIESAKIPETEISFLKEFVNSLNQVIERSVSDRDERKGLYKL